jgi:hypothetical protein
VRSCSEACFVNRRQVIGALGKEQAEAILPPDVKPAASDPKKKPEPSNPASSWLPFSTLKPPTRAAVSLPAFQEDTALVHVPRPATQHLPAPIKTSGIRSASP